MRDLEADRSKNKRTLANILGREASRWEYYILVGGSYLLLVILVSARRAPLCLARPAHPPQRH